MYYKSYQIVGFTPSNISCSYCGGCCENRFLVMLRDARQRYVICNLITFDFDSEMPAVLKTDLKAKIRSGRFQTLLFDEVATWRERRESVESLIDNAFIFASQMLKFATFQLLPEDIVYRDGKLAR